MADDISKLCSDYLRVRFPGLKASHARELVAAFFGYKSHAALLSEEKYKLDELPESFVLVPALALIDHRRTCLEKLAPGVADSDNLAADLVEFLREKELFTGEAWLNWDIGAFMIDEYLPKHMSGSLDTYLAEAIAETNAYFGDHEYKTASIEETADLLTIKVDGTFHGEMDPDADRMFAGDTIDFVAIVELYRVAGRVAYMEPEMDASGAVRRDYYDDGPEDELPMNSISPNAIPPTPAERNLDVEVAELLGWTHYSAGHCATHPGHGHWELNGREGNIPAYTTEMDAANEVVNHMAKEGFAFSHIKGGISFHKELISYEAYGRDTARAICEAALVFAGKIDPKASPLGQQLVRTYNDAYDGYPTYRIKHYVNGELVDDVSAGELEHRLRHALQYWHLTPVLQAKLNEWIAAYRPGRKPSEGRGRTGGSRSPSRRR